MREISDKSYIECYQEFLSVVEDGITVAAERGFTKKDFIFYGIEWCNLSEYVKLMRNELEQLGYTIVVSVNTASRSYFITVSWT